MLGSDQVRERGKRKWLDSGYILKTELVVRFEVGYSSRWRADSWGAKERLVEARMNLRVLAARNVRS